MLQKYPHVLHVKAHLITFLLLLCTICRGAPCVWVWYCEDLCSRCFSFSQEHNSVQMELKASQTIMVTELGLKQSLKHMFFFLPPRCVNH